MCGILLLGALGLRTHLREREYRNEVAIWQATVQAVPRSAKAHYNLGNALARRGENGPATDQFRESLGIDPDNAAALNNLATMLLSAGDPAGALTHLDRAASEKPDWSAPRIDSLDSHRNTFMPRRTGVRVSQLG